MNTSGSSKRQSIMIDIGIYIYQLVSFFDTQHLKHQLITISHKYISTRYTTVKMRLLGFPAIILCSILFLNVSGSSWRVSQLKSTLFQLHYSMTDGVNNKTLLVQCKSYKLLSIRIVDSPQQPQMPSYSVFKKQDNHSMNRNFYTFLENCRTTVNITQQSEFKISLTRDDEATPFFEIDQVLFSQQYRKIVTLDNSVKWGLGERFQSDFHVADGLWTIWNRDRPWVIDNGNPSQSQQTYGHQPLYLARSQVSKKFHLVYFKSIYAMNVEVSEQKKVTYHVIDGNLQFLIFIGTKDPEMLLRKYHDYIGASHIPPFWAMGWHQCRWGYKNIHVLKEVVDSYDSHQIPLDTIWTDLEYMKQKQDFTVDELNFPLQEFKRLLQRVHYVPLIDAGISLKTEQAMRYGKDMNVFIKKGSTDYVAQVWPGAVHFVDFLHPNASAYWSMMLDLLYERISFSGIWLDMNEMSNFVGGRSYRQEPYKVQHSETLQMMTADMDVKFTDPKNSSKYYSHAEVHAYYGHLETLATYQFLRNKGKRPFIITRSNSVGTGRYSGHWTGDNVASWSFLRLSVSGNYLYQIFGMQMVGADICGFKDNTTVELCARWTQVGSLYPFSRNHNQLTASDQEPYKLGETMLKTAKLSLDFRYSFLKQYYSIYVKSKGLGSLFRPLFWQFPEDEACYEKNVVEQQFLIGKFIMGVPMLNQSMEKKKAYFPGLWYSVQDGSRFQNNMQVINRLPAPPSVFLRAGYIGFFNVPRTRTKDLDSNFSLKIGFLKAKAQGFIMSLRDYEDNTLLEQCINKGCFYEFQAELQPERSKVILSWKYVGIPRTRMPISIASLLCFSEEGVKWKSISLDLAVNADGSTEIDIRKQ